MKGSLNSILKFVRAIKPDAHTVGAITGPGIDCQGFDEAAFFTDVGTIGTSVDVRVQESDDDGVADAYVNVTGALITQIVGSDDAAIIRLNLMNRKRWLRVILDAGGTEDAAVMCVLANFKYNPVTQVATTEVVDVNA